MAIAPDTMTKLQRDEIVVLPVLDRICDMLNADYSSQFQQPEWAIKNQAIAAKCLISWGLGSCSHSCVCIHLPDKISILPASASATMLLKPSLCFVLVPVMPSSE